MLRRPGADLFAPAVRVDPVLLAITGRDRAPRLTLRPRRRTPQLCLAIGDRCLDLRPALREHAQHIRRDLGQFGRTLVDRPPLQPQPIAHQRTQMRLVEIARGPGGPVQRRVMQRRVAAVLAARQVRRDDMRVQLRIERTTHPMAVGRRDQTAGVLEAHAARSAAHEHRRLLEVAERGTNRLLMGFHERRGHLGRRDREQHADRLRRRERQVKRGDRRLAVAGSKPHSRRPRIASLEQRVELRCAHLTGEAELFSAAAGPLAGRLAATRVVVVPALGDLLLVVALLAQYELSNRQHESKLAKSSSLGDTVCC